MNKKKVLQRLFNKFDYEERIEFSDNQIVEP